MVLVTAFIAKLLIFVALIVGAVVVGLGLTFAHAQQPQAQPDSRLTQPTITAMQGLLALREAELAATRADWYSDRAAYEARLETAMEWLKAAQAEKK